MIKNIILNLNNERPHDGEYFKIIYFNSFYLLYYCINSKLYVIKSQNLDFNNKDKINLHENIPGGGLCIIQKNEELYMLCGYHYSGHNGYFPPKNGDGVQVPNFVFSNKTRFLHKSDYFCDNKINGIYLLKSKDGIKWNYIKKTPIISAFIKSETVKYGEVGFDTSPYIIKFKHKFYYFSRLNPGFENRKIFLCKSSDLINWDPPIKVNIKINNDLNYNTNFYNIVVINIENVLYGFIPYFEASTNKIYKNGKTLIVKSNDAINWEVIHSILPHSKKYKHRINSVMINNDDIYLFYRENVTEINQKIVYYKFKLVDLNIIISS